MKIEKVNENQLRCFITREELEARKMKISELAYGTEKARGLFREMMKFARKNFGFETDDLPLMIEAIPLSPDVTVLTVTKIALPDENDGRFAYFDDDEFEESLSTSSAYSPEIPIPSDLGQPKFHGAKEIIESFKINPEKGVRMVRHFTFNNLDSVIEASKAIEKDYVGYNDLYKDHKGKFHLILAIAPHFPEEFNKVCNCLSEYGVMQNPESNSYSKVIEHGEHISGPDAVGDLSIL